MAGRRRGGRGGPGARIDTWVPASLACSSSAPTLRKPLRTYVGVSMVNNWAEKDTWKCYRCLFDSESDTMDELQSRAVKTSESSTNPPFPTRKL